MNFPRFNIDAATAKINTFSMNVHDYQMVTPTLARVVLSYTGHLPTETDAIHNQIAKLFKQNASAVPDSFSAIGPQSGNLKAMIGFVKANREVIPFEDAETAGVKGEGAKYKAMASNLLMDTADNTMWEIRSGATGKYLAKQNHADLSELVHLATASVHGLPKFSQIASMPVATQEFASFVDKDSEEVLSGFVVASGEDSLKIYSFETKEVIEASFSQLVEVVELTAEEAKIGEMEMTKEVAASESEMIEYYRKAYSYSPEYINKIIDMIKQHRFG